MEPLEKRQNALARINLGILRDAQPGDLFIVMPDGKALKYMDTPIPREIETGAHLLNGCCYISTNALFDPERLSDDREKIVFESLTLKKDELTRMLKYWPSPEIRDWRFKQNKGAAEILLSTPPAKNTNSLEAYIAHLNELVDYYKPRGIFIHGIEALVTNSGDYSKVTKAIHDFQKKRDIHVCMQKEGGR